VRFVVDVAFGLATEVVLGVQEPVWVLGAPLGGEAVAVVGWKFVVAPAVVQEVVLAVAPVVVLESVPGPEPVVLVGVPEAEVRQEVER